MSDRGVIRNREYATQIRDFSSLRFGNITPTDIDGLIDFQNKAFVIIETKFKGGKMPFGQRLAIERLTDIIGETGRKSIALIAEYENSEGDIDFAKAMVVEYRMRREWRMPKAPLDVKSAIDKFLASA